MNVDDSLKEFRDQLQQLVEQAKDLTPIAGAIRNILLTSIDRNFSEGGRYGTENVFGGGSTRWKPSGRAQGQDSTTVVKRDKAGKFRKQKVGGQTLVDTGQLAASIQVHVVGNTVQIGTNKIYGAIHNYGGTAGRNQSARIPARPFLVIQNEDLEDIGTYIARLIFK